MVSYRAEGRLEESDRLKRAVLEQRNQSELVDQKHLAELARLEEAKSELERERERARRELDMGRKRCQEKDAKTKDTEKAVERTRRYADLDASRCYDCGDESHLIELKQ